jgi:hypothetical protein
VDLGDGERGLTLTTEGRDLLHSHVLERDTEPSQMFYAGASRSREIDHDSNLYATFRQEEADYKQRLQQLFVLEGIAFDGNRFNRTAVTAPLFNSLAPSESADEKMVSRLGIEPRTRRLRGVQSDRNS